VGTLTDVSAPSAVSGPRPAGRLGARPASYGSDVEALHTEIDNPFDLVAGDDLLGAPNALPSGPAPRAPWTRAAATRVFLLERHPVASAGLRSVLAAVPGMTVVGSSADLGRALEAVGRVRPDVILLGRGESLEEDLAAVVGLRHSDAAPDARVLLLRRAESAAEAARILLAGGCGCFPLDLGEEQIIGAVALAAAGGSVFLPTPPTAHGTLPAPSWQNTELLPQHCGLTRRERDVLAQLARGLSNAEIGRALGLAEATVKKHLTQAMRKTGQSDRLRAALYAHRHGLAS
jgi:DNA-binding NarL/FixJ family response regulator